MLDAAARTDDPPAACPFHAASGTTSVATADAITPATALVLPMPQRLVLQHARGENGAPELRLYHERKEVTFDDPATFGFGEALARHERFRAGDACAWGDGYAWADVQPMLQALIDEGVLRRATDADLAAAAAPRRDADEGARPSPLPPAPNATPRRWDEAATLMRELTGRALDPAHVELVIPIFRVAHMAVDADGRQVGEANVFPPALRLDVPTRWRACIYPGTRHRLEGQPMNVSALKGMRAHWGQMMALLLHVRGAYLARCPAAAAGWTVGHLERLSTAVLALPTLLLERRDAGRVGNGDLHPALSSLFRVTDGLRMTLHQMLFVPIGEPALHPDTPMSARAIHDYAERNYSFHSEHGVCAGPRAMIDEFLAVIVDGRLPKDGLAALDADPALAQAVAATEAALDYALLGLQAYAAVFSLWPEMARRYERLAGLASDWAARAPRSAAAAAMHARFEPHRAALGESTFLAAEAWRTHRDAVYADMWQRCGAALGDTALAPLPALLAPAAQAHDHAAAGVLAGALERWATAQAGHALDADDRHALADLHAAILEHLQRVRALLGTAEAVQARINAHLARPAPRRALEAADLDLHNRLQGATRRRLPYLIDELEAWLDLRIRVTSTAIEVTAPIRRHGAGWTAPSRRTRAPRAQTQPQGNPP